MDADASTGSNVEDSREELVPNEDDSIQDDIDIVDGNSSQQKTKRKRVDYNVDQVFNSSDDAIAFMATEKVWVKKQKTLTEEGAKHFYRCKNVKERRKQCAAAVYLLYDATSPRVFLFRSSHDHNCQEMDDDAKSGPKLTGEVVKMIQDLHDQKKKPMDIRDALKLLKMPVPKLYTIKYQIAKYRKQKYGPTAISMRDLRGILKPFTVVPDGDEAAYILQDINADAEYFRFFLTTKALIKNATHNVSINADATYKVLWQGFPCLIVGTTDQLKNFHIIGAAVCSGETEADFQFVFRSMKQSALDLLNVEIAPTAIVCDAAHAISNAFKSVFGPSVSVIMCWAHVLRNVKKNANVREKQSNPGRNSGGHPFRDIDCYSRPLQNSTPVVSVCAVVGTRRIHRILRR